VSASRHILRLNGLIREELSELLRRETEDPELQGLISITEVDTESDLKLAKVYVSMLGDDEQMARVMHRLGKAARFFRRELARRLNLRHTPELEFHLDPSIARGARVMELLGALNLDGA
jgi:ribosome-binding factor A